MISIYKIYILRLTNDSIPRYVGITSGDLSKRLVRHIHDIKRESCKNIHKKNWISKYRNDIIIEQIDTAISIDDMKNKEIYYIKKFRDSGIDLINATDGGDGSYGYKHLPESIIKMSGINNHMYGKKHTPDWIENAKKRVPHNKGKRGEQIACNKGIPCSDEMRERLVNYRMGTHDSDETKLKKSKSSKSYLRKKPIECLIDNKWVEFKSASDAANHLNLIREKIILVCKGNRNHTGGYKFRYKNNI